MEAEDPDRQTPRWFGKIIYVIAPPVLGVSLAVWIGGLVRDPGLVVSQAPPPQAREEVMKSAATDELDPLDTLAARARPRARIGLCTVRFQSHPSGARVEVNGEELGHTPLPATTVPCGPVSVIMTHDSYQPYTRTIEVAPGERAEVIGELIKTVRERSQTPPVPALSSPPAATRGPGQMAALPGRR